MRHLFKAWKRIEGLISKSPRILLLVDYDGTLTPIAPRPEDAVLKGTSKKILKKLSENKRFDVGVISGRRLADVKKLVGLKGIYYAGDHGFEIIGPNISFLHPAVRRFKPYLARIKKRLLLKTKDMEGVIVEHKGASISLHYRLAKERDINKLKGIFMRACAPYVRKGRAMVAKGKKVWEVRLPINWNKGAAVQKISKTAQSGKKRALSIYLGDNATDEDAFSFLRGKKSVTVFVGRKKADSAAEYYLRSPKEVMMLLMKLSKMY